MPIQTSCPNCDAPYTLADTMAGKQVRCKTCQQVFAVKGTSLGKPQRSAAEDDLEAKVKPRGPRTSRPPRDEDDLDRPRRRRDEADEDRPRAGKAGRRHDEDAPRRRSRDDDDDDDRRPRQKKSNNMPLIIGLIAGGVLLVGGGITLAIVLGSKKTPEEELAEKLKKEFEDGLDKLKKDVGKDIFKDGFKDLAKDGFKDFGKDVFKDKFKDIKKDGFPNFDKNIGKKENPLNLGQHLVNLGTGDDQAKRQALQFFGGLDPNQAPAGQRADVAKALEETFATLPRDTERTLVRWATKDQVPTLIQILQFQGQPDSFFDRRGATMDALAKLKDERGVEPVLAYLGKPGDGDRARKALETFGAVAEPALIPRAFHKEWQVREGVQNLLNKLRTPKDKLIPEGIKALASPDVEIRKTGVEWFIKTPALENFRPEVARALDSLLVVKETRFKAFDAVKVWGSKENVATLVHLLGQQPTVPHAYTMETLAKIKDASAAEAVASQFPKHQALTSRLLVEMGSPLGQKAALAYMNHPEGSVRFEALRALKDLKTKEDMLITQALKDVTAPDARSRQGALDWLAKAKVVAPRRGEVTQTVQPYLKDPDKNVQVAANQAYSHWAGKGGIEPGPGDPPNPALLGKLIQEVGAVTNPNRHQSMTKLSKYKDAKAAVAIALRLNHLGDRNHAAKLLRDMGPAVAEPAVVQMLNSKDGGARHAAVHILRDIGTPASIKYLQFAANLHPKDKSFAKEILQAINSIQVRARTGSLLPGHDDFLLGGRRASVAYDRRAAFFPRGFEEKPAEYAGGLWVLPHRLAREGRTANQGRKATRTDLT